jgi:serine/threonine protein kinase
MSRIRIFGLPPGQVGRLLSAGGECPPTQRVSADAGADPTATTACSLEQPGHWVGRYRLLSILGEGGMGVVYLAEQDHPIRRQVALKVIKPGMDSKRVLARFEAEQQALALMEHPHVARVYDAGLAPSGRPYFVMEHVKGLPITDHCDKYRLTIEQRLHLFLDVCAAVQHAHQKGIIHRDLKPSNILVTIQGEESIPKVIDFGVARAISQPLTERTLYTEQGQLLGTPEYMSPEQADLTNQDIDTRTDIYSLGVVLYELLAGVLPFDPQTFRTGGLEHIRQVICEEDAKTPSTRLSRTSVEESTELARRRQTDLRTLCRRLRGDLDWITLKALEKDRTRRYPTVDALAADIRSHLDQQPVRAAPPGTAYRARKFLRRHRSATAATGMALLLLVVALWAVRADLRAGQAREQALGLEHQRVLDQAEDLVAEGRFSDANEMVAPLVASARVGRQARLLDAEILLNQQKVDLAAQRLEQLLDTRDDVAGQAHLLLAGIYYDGDPEDYERYRHHHQEAQKLIAGTADYCFLQAQGTYDVQAMLGWLNQALELDSQHYDSLYQRACIHYAQKDVDPLRMDAHALTIVRPHSPQGYNLRAIALREMGRGAEAIADHNQAIRCNPSQARLYEERGRTYARMGRYEMALADARTCVDLEPNNPSYLHRLFGVYTTLGRYDEAEQIYQSPSLAGYQQSSEPDAEPKLWFFALSFKLVFDSLGRGQAWHGPMPPPTREPFGAMYYADQCYTHLSRKARRVISHGFHPSWSPDGRKLVYAQGTGMGSALVVRDLGTGRTELLLAPGREPRWSPDGRHIAFMKTQRLLPLTRLGALNLRDLWTVREAPPQPAEVWVMDLNTRDIRCIAKGGHPHWGKSGFLYYSQDHMLYAVSPSPGAKPVVVVPDCFGDHPLVSPDERYVADVRYPELRIIELGTRRPVASWTIPPQLALWTASLQWSPDSRTVSVGNFMASDMGLWIYDLGTRTASWILEGPVAAVSRSPDGHRLAIGLSAPYFEIWIAEVNPNLSILRALGAARTMTEHGLEIIDIYNGRLETDPNSLFNHLQRTVFALWIHDANAPQYLKELEDAFRRAPYNAAGCLARARAVLNNPAEFGPLLPLARVLLHKAFEKRGDLAGSCRYDRATGVYTLVGIGADIWDTMDDFHFAYRTLQGDGSITARIDSIENVSPYPKAGLMIRDNLETSSPNAFALVRAAGTPVFQHRATAGTQTTTTWRGVIEGTGFPCWLKLTRTGNRFTAEYSSDGMNWQAITTPVNEPVSVEIPMRDTVYVGLAVTSLDPSRLAEARISHVKTTGNVSPSGPFTESQDIRSPLPPLPAAGAD